MFGVSLCWPSLQISAPPEFPSGPVLKRSSRKVPHRAPGPTSFGCHQDPWWEKPCALFVAALQAEHRERSSQLSLGHNSSTASSSREAAGAATTRAKNRLINRPVPKANNLERELRGSINSLGLELPRPSQSFQPSSAPPAAAKAHQGQGGWQLRCHCGSRS